MKASFLLLAMLLVISGCAGPKWIKAGENEIMTYYVNATPREKANGRMITWELVNLKAAQEENNEEYKSYTAQFEYDCVAEKRRINYIEIYSKNMAKGKLIRSGKSTDPDREEWVPVTPGKMDESILIFESILISVCYTKAQPAVSTNTQNNDLMNILLWSLLLDGHHH